MVFKVFLDANIILDFMLKRERYKVAQKIIAMAVGGNIYAFTTPAVIHIVSYWVTKAYGKQKTKKLVAALLEDVTVIDADHQTAIHAVHSDIDDIEDALQYYTALYHKLGYFISGDKQLKKSALPVLPIYTAEEFLAML